MRFIQFLLLVVLLNISPLVSTTPKFNTTGANYTIMKADVITIRPECQSKCGDLMIPYPFGIDKSCSINPTFVITCNEATDPPKAFLMGGDVQVYDVSNTQLRKSNVLAFIRYDQLGNPIEKVSPSSDLGSTTYMYSDDNVFTVVGCDDYGNVYNNQSSLPKGCSTTCENIEEVPENGACLGSGCCQVPIDLLKNFTIVLDSYNKHIDVSFFSDSGYAFLGERGRFIFGGKSDLNDSNFRNRTMETVPVVLDWVIGKKNCIEATKEKNSSVCYKNSECVDGTRYRGYDGYRCKCNEGYEGNPYLEPGCQDINECKQEHGCDQLCTNTDGNYSCACRRGFDIDVTNDKKCIPKISKSKVIWYPLAIGVIFLFVIIGISWVYCHKKKQKEHFQLRKKFFEQNGGLLLRQRSISEGSNVESTKHYTYEELKKATNNYAADRIVGQGGNGIVYKGILPDQRIVAVKRSKGLDLNQVDQFINEVVILAQVNHRNVVKLLGCCLECEVPMLVYEFVSNGTLHHHVHSIDGGLSWLSLDNRLRIAAESSGALAYLHSEASMPIIHRDVKLANILVDDNCVSKISDFGASRLVPLDQTRVITLVQGTLGYLDPEYFHTGELTDKSDVYSFGVVLAELLTGRKPICMDNSIEERSLATYFITSLEENRLFQILDGRVVREGEIDQLKKAAWLVKRCLNFNGEERPTMKEVTMKIESLRKLSKHNVVNGSEQCSSSSTISLLHPPSSPR